VIITRTFCEHFYWRNITGLNYDLNVYCTIVFSLKTTYLSTEFQHNVVFTNKVTWLCCEPTIRVVSNIDRSYNRRMHGWMQAVSIP